jgi:hypothetical protein
MMGVLASGPTPGICQRKPCATPSQNPHYKVHSKIEQINLAKWTLANLQNFMNEWLTFYIQKEVLETLWTSTIKVIWAYVGWWESADPTLDPTFGSFTLLDPVSHSVNQCLWWKCLDCLD